MPFYGSQPGFKNNTDALNPTDWGWKLSKGNYLCDHQKKLIDYYNYNQVIIQRK